MVSLIILYDGEGRFLLQHRSIDAELLPGRWAFFGGGIEAGETPEDAVQREAREELNYSVKSPRLVCERDFEEKKTKGHMYVFVEHFSGNKDSLKLGEGQGWGWYGEGDVEKLDMIDRDRDTVRAIAKYLKEEATKV